jgi:hypothetical protein
MAAAFWADPELIGRPRHVRPGIAHVHLGAAPHAANVNADVAHAGDSVTRIGELSNWVIE